MPRHTPCSGGATLSLGHIQRRRQLRRLRPLCLMDASRDGLGRGMGRRRRFCIGLRQFVRCLPPISDSHGRRLQLLLCRGFHDGRERCQRGRHAIHWPSNELLHNSRRGTDRDRRIRRRHLPRGGFRDWRDRHSDLCSRTGRRSIRRRTPARPESRRPARWACDSSPVATQVIRTSSAPSGPAPSAAPPNRSPPARRRWRSAAHTASPRPRSRPTSPSTWSSLHGSITGSGSSITYTAPGTGSSDSVTWTSVDLPTHTATASITLTGTPSATAGALLAGV